MEVIKAYDPKIVGDDLRIIAEQKLAGLRLLRVDDINKGHWLIFTNEAAEINIQQLEVRIKALEAKVGLT